ncbi:hypothetical protein BpHYR1_047111 [Brachionus plicatilis]|uniref:Uncharacterized protein n=1 Tax=Brachionus plicatilis TaxID=10195 RepID=A0A3M7Q1W8_BRAPC|nr:hypothetical protein BpHYR1_047111 [Brachionus plicatilis]
MFNLLYRQTLNDKEHHFCVDLTVEVNVYSEIYEKNLSLKVILREFCQNLSSKSLLKGIYFKKNLNNAIFKSKLNFHNHGHMNFAVPGSHYGGLSCFSSTKLFQQSLVEILIKD